MDHMDLDNQAQGGTMCIECEDTTAGLICDQCGDAYCELCFKWLHAHGTRATHTFKELPNVKTNNNAQSTPITVHQMVYTATNTTTTNSDVNAMHITANSPDHSNTEPTITRLSDDTPVVDAELLKFRDAILADLEQGSLLERSKCIPLRITEEERALLRLLEGALNVSEYTDNVDVADSDYGSRFWGFSWWSQPYSNHQRSGDSRGNIIKRELDEILDLLLGFRVCTNFKAGSTLLKGDAKKQKIEFWQKVFEVGRRYKIMNPDKMRTTYGKMMYILQDSAKPGRMPFSLKIPIKTVYTLLEEKDSLHLVRDPEPVRLLLLATREIAPNPLKSKEDLKYEADQKSTAVKQLLTKFKSDKLSEDDIMRCIHSIADNNTFITLDRLPVDRMLHYLTTYFTPKASACPSLAIYAGLGGSKLSHDHGTQFSFVLQSLMLWREVITRMFELWFKADCDLLSETHTYQLRDTGQGVQRVQESGNVASSMRSILGSVQSRVQGWVGLSVVHLADRDVPNALVFIDKYTQVARILKPIVQCLDALPVLAANDKDLANMFDELGGVEHLRKVILVDYFQHGFDGSGSDGGSCIDGRLTSSWNWCSKIEKKPFYHLFLLTGFKGFDGSFK